MSDERKGILPFHADDGLRRRVKMELRKRMRGLRQALPTGACAERSARIVERLLALEVVRSARGVALFWPMEERHEVDLRALDVRLRERGVRLAYPSVDAETEAMTFRVVAHPSAMQPRAFGFHEPSPLEPEALPSEIDVIIVPALAADPGGQRIGYGGGYYDKTLPLFAPPASTVAVLFDFQLIAESPITEGDVPAGSIVTDARTLQAQRGD